MHIDYLEIIVFVRTKRWNVNTAKQIEVTGEQLTTVWQAIIFHKEWC